MIVLAMLTLIWHQFYCTAVVCVGGCLILSALQREKLPDDVDVYSVSSVRRNPILADLFQRLGFMERRGSGLRKIREETSWCANYKDAYKPQFYDDGHHFTVTLWNMNYPANNLTGQVIDNATVNLTVGC